MLKNSLSAFLKILDQVSRSGSHLKEIPSYLNIKKTWSKICSSNRSLIYDFKKIILVK